MLYELYFDYEIFHLQLKICARFFLYLLQRCACCRCSDSNIKSTRAKPSAWLCEVHVNDEIDDDQSPDAESYIMKFFKWIRHTITEDDIQSLIITERNYKKHHREMEKQKDKEDND
ncbi:unnamed protein product [Didymodactylos carnosus]|uniref:Uncharacterized protein n=1 Tax=Didymodactylos carnosus TaxID=1234261 RepID=A0A815LZA9_9BILA|nr:unnamed protein product [Didymodactylos carnosus]CAF1415302.1 unnamed protein product [Didymodactylos carnosus]CAF3922129.1 unnamed protein product [Didymodactylos carnosus]CAF4301567.1 unnamed protein product [Didymodactylos carnosus]